MTDINVLFFARFREELGVAQLNVDSAGINTVDCLIKRLVDESSVEANSTKWEQVLRAANVIMAVNHKVVEPSCGIKAGDEVAFYPPVTGG